MSPSASTVTQRHVLRPRSRHGSPSLSPRSFESVHGHYAFVVERDAVFAPGRYSANAEEPPLSMVIGVWKEERRAYGKDAGQSL